MKKLKTLVLLVALLSLVVVIPALAGPPVTVDSFDETAQQVIQASVGVSAPSSQTGPSILGGERDVVVQNTFAGGGSGIIANFNVAGSSRFAHDQGTGDMGKTIVTWDGNADLNKASVDAAGLGGIDLTAGGDSSALVLALIASDAAMSAKMTIYNASNQCASLTLPLVDLTGTESSIALPFVFAAFTDASCPGGAFPIPAGFTSVGAVVLEVDGTAVASADASFDWFRTGSFDYGDLPNTFGTLYASNGAAHFVPASPDLYLGSEIDPESDGVPAVDADGDNLANLDDEDGVVPSGTWTTTTGAVDVEVTGSGCVNGWIDWNGDGDFVTSLGGGATMWDTGEFVVQSQPQTDTVKNYSFAVQASFDPADNSVYARFRVMPTVAGGGCATVPTAGIMLSPADRAGWDVGMVANGEVEDYLFSFNTNAVVASGMAGAGNFGVAAVVMGVVAMAGVVVLRKRK